MGRRRLKPAKLALLFRWLEEKRIRELICASKEKLLQRQLTHESIRLSSHQRSSEKTLFRLGADRALVDQGFCTKRELQYFLEDSRAAVKAIQATLSSNQPQEVADGRF